MLSIYRFTKHSVSFFLIFLLAPSSSFASFSPLYLFVVSANVFYFEQVDRGGDSNAETTATNPGAGVSPSATAMMPPPRVPTQPGESTVGRRWPRRNNDDVDGVVEGQPGPAARRAAAAAATAAETARGRAPYGGGGDNGGGITGRPSLDSAAGSIAVSSIVHSSNKNGSSNNSNSNQYFRSPPGSSVGGAGVGAGAVGGAGIRSGDAAQDSLNSRADGGVGRGDDDDGGSKNASIPGVHDDDAASQYAGSGVGVIPVGEDGRGTSWRAGDGRAGGMALGAGGGEGRAEDRRLGARPTRFGGLTSGPSGKFYFVVSYSKSAPNAWHSPRITVDESMILKLWMSPTD